MAMLAPYTDGLKSAAASTSSASSAGVSLSERSKSVPVGWRAAAATVASTRLRAPLAGRLVLEIVVGPHPLPEHEADVLRVIDDRVREPPVQFLRERRLARAEPAVDPDDHWHKLSGYPWAVLHGADQPGW
jgi:hypothetical protein